jgi:hypothetical protein
MRKTPVLRWPISAVYRLEHRFPVAARRLFLMPRLIYPKAMGLFAESYAILAALDDRPEYMALARQCAQWLLDNGAPGYRGLGWGLPIDYEDRGLLRRGTPCGIVGAVCGQAFWRLYKMTGEAQYLDACRRVCDGFVYDLNVDRLGDDRVCFSYTPLDHYHIHNANLWVAAFLVRIGLHLNDKAFVELGRQAGNYSRKAQLEDGSLPYLAVEQDANIRCDNLHSGFEIRAMHELWKMTGEEEYRKAVERYLAYYVDHFCAGNEGPWLGPNPPRVTDVHGCAEVFLLHTTLKEDFPEAAARLEGAMAWTLDHMQSPRGYFYYRWLYDDDGGGRVVDLPCIRWGQAWMLRGLTSSVEYLRMKRAVR